MNKENLANAVVASASGTTIVLDTGYASGLPATPFMATVAPNGELPTKLNSEIVQVTDVTDDTLTVVRAQYGTSEQAIAAGWIFGNGVYVQDLQEFVSSST